MNDDETNRFRFSFQVRPKSDVLCKLEAQKISELLQIDATKIYDKASWNDIDGRTWLWEYGSDWIDYIGEMDSELVNFLRMLPDDPNVWSKLSEECDYFLYIPLQRDYFLIEFTIDLDVLHELAIRCLRIEFSAKYETKN